MEYIIVCVELFIMGGLVGWIVCNETQVKSYKKLLDESLALMDDVFGLNKKLLDGLNAFEKEMPIKSPIHIKRV